MDWARARSARGYLAEGVIHVEQPREAIAAIGIISPARRAAPPGRTQHLMTTLTGSALLAIAVDFSEIDAETAWSAAHVDEDCQTEHWGQDAEAMVRRAARKRDMIAAADLNEAIRT